MRQITKDWMNAAEDDLLAAKTLAGESRLTNVSSFHCQQCLEKCLKAVIDELHKPFIKSHDLLRLQSIAEIQMTAQELEMLAIINEVYIDSRYPGDLGLLSNGKPTNDEITEFIHFCEVIFIRINSRLV